jgi:hypothetical protein
VFNNSTILKFCLKLFRTERRPNRGPPLGGLAAAVRVRGVDGSQVGARTPEAKREERDGGS